ncbi:M48 family metallopeptidase [Acaryochloris sp. IP29b_bin.137]|uniref:M48 family metallopeptidase n=1 Tax=Acaryochloris sp. IP29b_bin.137 TaxID=2969217 RepID=UPI002619B881|nr:M48 family metallopeptidase [Acaryochloris sp. IP29b_bin.137]
MTLAALTFRLSLILTSTLVAVAPSDRIKGQQDISSSSASLERLTAESPTPSVGPKSTPASSTETSDASPATPEAKPADKGPEQTDSSSQPEGSASEDGTPAEVEQSTQSSQSLARQKLILEADQLYQAGQIQDAEVLYRQAKLPFFEKGVVKPPADPIHNPEQLPPGGRVYWREALAGKELNLKTRIFVPLRLLVKEYPQFMPGHLQLAESLAADRKPEEALAVMARAAALYPDQPNLQKGLIKQQTQAKQWLEASITARQFALLNPDHPDSLEFSQLSKEYQDRFRARLRTQITNNTIGSFITGALGIAITGSPIPGLSALQTSILLLRGETAVGNAIANRAKRQLPLIENPDVQAYVDRIAQKLTPLAGRAFNYQFYVVNNEKLNAFALPGGKIFINGGAILKSNSEAELAGLIAHELSHAVLSHGFQIATESAEAGGLTRLIPYVGGLFTNLVVADYSREMEQQADILGTRLLASANYAADGLRNLMVTLSKEDKPFVAPWFSSHPGSLERVRYLERLITDNGYNRYAYEGMEEHQRIQALVRAEITKAKDEEESEGSTDQSEPNTNESNSDTQNDTNSDTETRLPPIPPTEETPSVEEPQPNAGEIHSSTEELRAPETTSPEKTPTTDQLNPAN